MSENIARALRNDSADIPANVGNGSTRAVRQGRRRVSRCTGYTFAKYPFHFRLGSLTGVQGVGRDKWLLNNKLSRASPRHRFQLLNKLLYSVLYRTLGCLVAILVFTEIGAGTFCLLLLLYFQTRPHQLAQRPALQPIGSKTSASWL